jgi:Domain of unknown function (DUF4124)
VLRMVAIVVALLALAGQSRAEEVWRWTGSDGRVHYSNEQSRAPGDAEIVRTQIRIVSSAPRKPERLERGRSVYRAHRPRYARAEGFPSARCGSAYGYIVLNNPHELADQVKQASLLDALGVPWRTGGCR